MKHIILVVCVFFTLTTFSQETTIHSLIRPLPDNITQEYANNSAQRHKLKFVKHKRKSVKIYVNGRYATTENIKELIQYCEKLLQFTTPRKAMVIEMNGGNKIGRINDRINVISVRITQDGEVFPMVMSVHRLESILAGLKTL